MNIMQSIKKIKKGYLIAIAVLSLVVIIQASLLLNPKLGVSDNDAENKTGAPNDTIQLMEQLREDFQNNSKKRDDIFDNFFNDNFFSQEDNPFKRLQEMQERLSKSFRGNNSNPFAPGWNSWYGNKFETDDMEITTRDKKDKIVMTFKIPGLKNNTMNLDINEKRIKLGCDIEEQIEEKDQDGNTLYQSKSHRHMSKILPVPDNVYTDNPKVETKDDELIITFQKIIS